MTELQKSRVNSAIAEGQDPEVYLSPRQIDTARRGPRANYVSTGLVEAWDKVK